MERPKIPTDYIYIKMLVEQELKRQNVSLNLDTDACKNIILKLVKIAEFTNKLDFIDPYHFLGKHIIKRTRFLIKAQNQPYNPPSTKNIEKTIKIATHQLHGINNIKRHKREQKDYIIKKQKYTTIMTRHGLRNNIPYICEYCGKEFQLDIIRVSSDRRFCSSECGRASAKKKIGELFKSDEHRQNLIEQKRGGIWYGSVRYYDGPQYCEKWTPELRERVRAFFNYRCVECGEPQGERKLHVHHVWYNKRLCCDETPRSLIALCPSCHGKTNNPDPTTREKWSKHFQEIIDDKYVGRSWMTREEFREYKRLNR